MSIESRIAKLRRSIANREVQIGFHKEKIQRQKIELKRLLKKHPDDPLDVNELIRDTSEYLEFIRKCKYFQEKYAAKCAEHKEAGVAKTFLDKLIEHTEPYESPGSFWKWSAYAAISAILRDSVWRGQGEGKLFPNIYVLFLAESGGRKGAPVDFCEKLVFKVNNTKIISGRASIQGILDELARAETDKDTGKVLRAGSAIFFAPELAAGIVGDPEAVNILTDIYDYKSNPYKSRLRTGPCFNLDKIVFSMLTASNEEMLKGFFDVKAKKGGLLARTFLVVPNEKRPPNSFMFTDMNERQRSFANVFSSFREIANLQGEMKLTEDAKKEYDSWYTDFWKKDKKDSTGALARVHTGVLKIAMLLAANDLTLEVDRKHIEKAIEDCMTLQPNYRTFLMGDGKSTLAAAGQIVLVALFTARGHKLSRKEILREHWSDVDGETLDKLAITLQQAGLIDTCTFGSEISYVLTQAGLNMLGGGK